MIFILTTLLTLRNISKHFGGVRALKGVLFDLRAGEVQALVGENGAGKSTLIKIVTGAHQPDDGEIEIAGQSVRDLDPVVARRLGIAAIYQQPALFPDLTVMENLALGEEPGGPFSVVNWSRRRRRAEELLQRVGAGISPDWEVRRLSMPQQQLVEIARALGADARIVIMDEPTASLGESDTEHLFAIIRELRLRGVGIIYISHRLEELPHIADRVTALRDGTLVGTHAMQDVSRADLIKLMVGRDLSQVFPKGEVVRGKTALSVEGLTSRAAGVADITLELRQGEILGLSGLVGAGRTELARVLFGIEPVDAGDISVLGRRVRIDSPATALANGIVYLPEDRRRYGVVTDMSVASNITLAVLKQISRAGWLNFSREETLAAELANRLQVKAASLSSPVETLSGGNQQKVVLAKGLAAKPTILILDEPTQGIDVGAKAEIHRLMSELASQGLAILMISSELPEILGMSDRIAVMHGGKLMATLDRAEATQERLLELALGHQAAGVST